MVNNKRKEYDKNWREKNKEKVKASQKRYSQSPEGIEHTKEYYQRNKDKIIARVRNYYLKNRDEILIKNSQYREKNREKIRAGDRKYRIKNREKLNADSRAYYQTNKKRLAPKYKAYRQKFKERITEYKKEYAKKNFEKILAYKQNFYKTNKEKLSRIAKENYLKHREKILQRVKLYRQTHPEKAREYRVKNRAHIREWKNLHRQQRGRFVLEYKKNRGCSNCGYNEYPEILQFHHSKKDKSFDISSAIGNKDEQTIRKEMDKCILLCPNCHFWLHFQEHKKK